MFGNWSISARDLLSSKKSYKIYKRKTNTSLNLTQLHIHIHNTNLKMNLYETPFLYSILAIRKTERL